MREKIADWYVQAEGLQVHPHPHHDRALARPDAGAGELHRQDGRARPLQDLAASAMELEDQFGMIMRPGHGAAARRVPGR